ncbi:MAG: universal stress protein [Acidimicrobiales bacterium]|nr:universal stress protein [Acidimicrobiales bacterium]
MVERLLLAVDDSPAALAATRVALALAAGWGATVRVVNVVRDGALADAIDEIRPDGGAEERLTEAGASMLAYVVRQAVEAGVEVHAVQRVGEAFRCILDEALAWDAAVIVMGRGDRRGPASPYVGSVVEHVLEFTERPVLVVPLSSDPDPDPDPGDEP